MDKVTEIIENEIDNVNFSVDQLVAQMGIARTKLFTKLKAITGQTPSDLIMTIRLKRAAYLLKNNPELNISKYLTEQDSAFQNILVNVSKNIM